MIVIAHHAKQTSHANFERMLPQIREQAHHAFRAARPVLKEELIAETIANAFCAFARLVERGKEDLAYASPLAGYAIRQVCSGRCVGTKLNVRDVSSRHAQRGKGITIERLDQFDAAEGEWREALVEDRLGRPKRPQQGSTWRLVSGRWLGRSGGSLRHWPRARQRAPWLGCSD